MSDKKRIIRVLIVDDIMDVRANIYNILKNEQDIEVVGFASNGKEAIEEFDRLVPDVMTTCVCMPEMDGIDASEIILNKHPDAIIIIISVMTFPEYMHRAIIIGVKDFISKPADKELISIIRKLYCEQN
jgi:two-component system chemotaxis response regulator CheY